MLQACAEEGASPKQVFFYFAFFFFFFFFFFAVFFIIMAILEKKNLNTSVEDRSFRNKPKILRGFSNVVFCSFEWFWKA